MYCRNCGFQVGENDNFCRRCGMPQRTVMVTEQKSAYEEQPKKSKAGKVVRIVLGSILLTVGVIVQMIGFFACI